MSAAARFYFSLALLMPAPLATPADAPATAADAPAKPGRVASPMTPQQALAEFRLPAGLRMELVASEPDIESPVAAAFDEDGKLWVVEMRDYPNGPAKGQHPLGRIKILEDTDGTGLYKTTSIFAETLLFANGIMPWKGGVIVTAAPSILYLKDTTGNGKADRREVLFEGFATQNPQLRVSHPELGIDNWIYVANGLRGGKIVRGGASHESPVNISGMDFRFDLIKNRAETVTGMGQYGNTFDDWGNRFVCTNRNHLIPIVLPNQYVKRNPYLAPPEPVRDNQGPGGAAKVYPLSSNFTTATAHAGEFTSSCSVTIYRGGLLVPQYEGAAFTCEPAGNLVHAERVIPNGADFRGESLFEKKEFLASPDDWFRPVNLFHGPDGALYVVDMYRAVIEHPQFMPPELRNRPDLLYGQDKGRIWRIVPEKHAWKRPKVPTRLASNNDLVKLLSDVNAWQRTTAQRMILERGPSPETVTELKGALSATEPRTVIAAARLLNTWGQLPESENNLINSQNPRIREHGVALCESYLAKSARLQKRVAELADDPDPRVRFQVALTLGAWDNDTIVAPLAKIALRDVDDKWTRAAVATSVPKRAGALIAALLNTTSGLTAKATPNRFQLLSELAILAGARGDSTEIADLLERLGKLPDKDALAWQMAALNGVAEGMGRRGVQLGVFLASLPESRKYAAEQAGKLLTEAAGVAADAKRPTPERVSAIRLLAHAAWTTAEPTLAQLLEHDPAQEIRIASIRALAAHPHRQVSELLMKTWGSYTPPIRREVLEAMLRQPDRITYLLDQVQAGKVRPGDIDALRGRQLANYGRADIRDRAKKLLQASMPADRQQVLARYKAALKLRADANRGKEVFQKNCTACHRIAGMGHEVGPNIADTLGKPPETLLLDILIPNAAIDNNYVNYIVTTKTGRVVTGIIVAETASSVTLKRGDAQTDVVLRQDIEDIQSTGMSLMPDGLEKTINLQEMADLLSFLKNWRFAGGHNPTEQEKK